MSRFLYLPLPFLFVAACVPSQPGANSSVDINAAAAQAQNSVDAYSENTGAEAVSETDAPLNSEASAETTSDDNDQTPLDPPAPGTPGGLPDDKTPVSEAPFTPTVRRGAANVVQTYYALLGEGKYPKAFGLREPGAAGAKTAGDFAASFARFSEYHANVGAPSDVDAGAGQRYVTVPVQIYARLKQGGTPFYQIGSATLHRTGDIDGATAAQKTWRIRSIDLKAAPKR